MSSVITRQADRRAQERWYALLALDEAKSAREQLRADGVSEHRIETLYPLDFSDFIGGLLPLLASQKLNYTSEDQLKDHFTIAQVLLSYSRRAFHIDIERQISESMRSQTLMRKLGVLEGHIRACLPATGEADVIATRIIYLLWYAFALYFHADELNEIRTEAGKFLLSVTDDFLINYDDEYALTVRPLQELLGGQP